MTREDILAAANSFQLVEAYPQDKYLPSHLVLGRTGERRFHALFAIDVAGDHVRVVTAYEPDPAKWEADLIWRKSK